ncbi:heme uptake protein IsdC [Paenibacillus qinlingensis]|uniref:heme uptake protein IsdC n=1 Tax=Paenibacillus qinlingensis TaxID=1837343 RepID=UPI00156307DE|nr:heme uptake protein IsdC [Paenibacillus qinlingensis]NQX59829.1 heme uptake protein IsdC [Paenibacillus qinlingensis]
MKKRVSTTVCVLMLIWIIQSAISSIALAASNVSDGTYSIDYVITKAENDSASMANDYFEKPAILKVKNGEITAQIQMNHSKWITVFKTAKGTDFPSAEVIKSNQVEDTRVVQFAIEDISKPLLSKIHVTVKDIDYDHDYTIRFLFDTNTLKLTESAAKVDTTSKALVSSSTSVSSKIGVAQQEKIVVNPQTGDDTPMKLLVGVLIVSGASIAALLISKRRRVQ